MNHDNKKEQERSNLHATIWKIANDLRGSVDGWDFKQYVLGILFYRFISENLTNYINAEERRTGAADFDYASLSDDAAEFGRADTVKEKGFYILPSELFENVRKRAKGEDNLNEILSGIFRNIENSAKGADSEDDIKGLFDDLDVNSNKLGQTVAKRNERLVKLLDSIGSLEIGKYEDNTIDVFGDTYEFLMTMYASSAGKSGGEFYTPQEVSELLAHITTLDKDKVDRVYDPAAGSGSLLLKFAKILGRDNVRQGFYGQEINLTTYNLARINMFLHDINFEKFNIAHGDTLLDPQHWDDEPFDAIVSNPPYSINWEGDANPLLINDPRFSPAGVLAPKSNADWAFNMHILSWLSTSGTAAVVCFPGIFSRAHAEQKIRKYFVDNNYIDAIISLPQGLFFGASIAVYIMVIKKSKSDNKILFINADNEYIPTRDRMKNSKKTKDLSAKNIDNILQIYKNRKSVEHVARLVDSDDIVANDYNLSVGSYVEAEDTTETVNITELNNNISEIVERQVKLRKQIDSIVADIESPEDE